MSCNINLIFSPVECRNPAVTTCSSLCPRRSCARPRLCVALQGVAVALLASAPTSPPIPVNGLPHHGQRSRSVSWSSRMNMVRRLYTPFCLCCSSAYADEIHALGKRQRSSQAPASPRRTAPPLPPRCTLWRRRASHCVETCVPNTKTPSEDPCNSKVYIVQKLYKHISITRPHRTKTGRKIYT